MAFARDVYTATGGQTDFTISFAYRSTDDILVYQNGTLLTVTTHYTFPNATTMRLVSGATADDTIIIQRATSQSTKLVDFTTGTLTEADLDDNADQMFYMAQEAIDIANTAMILGGDNQWDGDSKRITSLADGTADQDAVTKAQLDAASISAGNVIAPSNPGEDNYVLVANAGAWAWDSLDNVTDNLTAGQKTAIRTDLDVPQNVAAISAIAALTPAANKLIRYTSGSAGDLLDFLDEDDMSSDSATGIPSQQSVKAYVDGQGGAWTYLSEVDLTNGGADDQTSLTLANDEDFSGVNEIEIMMYGGGTNTSSQPPIIQVGPTGGVVTTGYANNTTYESSTSSNEAGQTDGLYLYGSVTNQWVNTSTYSAKLVLARLKPGSNTWLAKLSANEDAAVNATHGFGTIALAGEIADIRVTTPGGSALFDEGVINVRYR